MTWQKFYELYDMYGEESTVWDEYKQEHYNDDYDDMIQKIAKYANKKCRYG